jgi:hypothetical protein
LRITISGFQSEHVSNIKKEQGKEYNPNQDQGKEYNPNQDQGKEYNPNQDQYPVEDDQGCNRNT